jgi:hypothetical protein
LKSKEQGKMMRLIEEIYNKEPLKTTLFKLKESSLEKFLLKTSWFSSSEIQ